MSVWLDKPRHRLDGQLCDRLSKISLKFFPDLSCIRTALPCHPDGRTSAAPNLHIKASCVRTKGMIVWIVDLMHAISIYVARASGPWMLPSGRLSFECATCLMDERVQTGIHIVRMIAAIFPYLCFGNKSHCWSNTECRPDVLVKHSDGCKLEQFEASWHRGRSGRKVLVVGTNDALNSWTSGRYITSSERLQGIQFL
jgi:hypothetical protein